MSIIVLVIGSGFSATNLFFVTFCLHTSIIKSESKMPTIVANNGLKGGDGDPLKSDRLFVVPHYLF